MFIGILCEQFFVYNLFVLYNFNNKPPFNFYKRFFYIKIRIFLKSILYFLNLRRNLLLYPKKIGVQSTAPFPL